jgi:hypothetical protein
VRGYTKHSIKLMLLHELAHPRAKGMGNIMVMVQKSSVRVLNPNEVEQVATWERSTVVCQLWLGADEREPDCWPVWWQCMLVEPGESE